MRLLCVTPMFPEPAAPSFGCFIEAATGAMVASGEAEVTVLARQPGRRGWPSYVELLARGMAHRPGRYDLIWGHYFGAGGAVAVALASTAGRPVVITAHGSDVEAARRPLARASLRALAGRCDAVHFVSADLGRRAGELLGDLPAPTLVQPLGVDLTRLRPRTEPRLPGRTRLLLVGSFTPVKGWSDAVEALAHLADLDLELIGVGAGDASWVRERARAAGVADRLLLRGERRPAQMDLLYRDADLLLAPSRREGLGLVPLEAMACGVPVICSDAGGMAEYARDRINARVVPTRAPAALAAAVRELLADRALSAQLIAGGRATAARFDAQLSARTLLRLFGDVIGRASAGRVS